MSNTGGHLLNRWKIMTDDELFGIDLTSADQDVPQATLEPMQIVRALVAPRYHDPWRSDEPATQVPHAVRIASTMMADVRPAEGRGPSDMIWRTGEKSGVTAHQQSTSGDSQASANGQQRDRIMPPPLAPASLLHRFRPSSQAVPPTASAKDLAITSRLMSQVVQMFRAGKVEGASMIAQYSVDLFGQETYDSTLKHYLMPPHADISLPLTKLMLEDTANLIHRFDPASAARLFICCNAWTLD